MKFHIFPVVLTGALVLSQAAFADSANWTAEKAADVDRNRTSNAGAASFNPHFDQAGRWSDNPDDWGVGEWKDGDGNVASGENGIGDYDPGNSGNNANNYDGGDGDITNDNKGGMANGK